MKYTNQERVDIGQRIYDGEITRYQAAELYGISEQTARNYMIIFCSLMNSVPPILWDISHRTSINNSMPEIPKGAQLVYRF